MRPDYPEHENALHMAALEGDNAALRHALKLRSTALSQIYGRVLRLEEERATLEAEISASNSELDDLRAQLATIRTEAGALQGELQHTFTRHDQELAALLSELTETRAQMINALKEGEVARSEFDALQRTKTMRLLGPLRRAYGRAKNASRRPRADASQ